MNKISGYKVTNTGARRIVLFTVESELLSPSHSGKPPTTEIVYSYGPRNPLPQGEHEDAWEYTLPSGETYTHPNKHGCLHMILSDAIGADVAHTRQPKQDGFTKTHNRL